MKLWLLSICIVAFSWSGWAASVMSFSEWKQLREQEAQLALDKARQGADSKSRPGQAPEEPSPLNGGGRFHKVPEKALGLAEHNVQVANELTVNDYFALYLRLQNEAAFREGIEKLSKAETAELLLAYRSQFVETPTLPAHNFNAPSKRGKNPGH